MNELMSSSMNAEAFVEAVKIVVNSNNPPIWLQILICLFVLLAIFLLVLDLFISIKEKLKK